MTNAEQLTARFPFEKIDYRVVSMTQDKKRGQVAFYLDAREIMDQLDAAGAVWSDAYTVIDNNHVECRLTVDGVTRCDVGEGNEGDDSSHADSFKTAYTDAFKRAAVKHDIGRYLYGGDRVWVDLDEYKKPTADARRKIEAAYERLVTGGTGPRGAQEPRQAATANGAASEPVKIGSVTLTQFWQRTKALGLTPQDVFAEAGVQSFKDWLPAQFTELLVKLEAKQAVPA